MRYLSLAITLLSSLYLAIAEPQETTRTANTEIGGPTTVSATETTGSTDSTSDEHTANTIVSGPTTLSATTTTQSTDSTSDEHTANTIVSGPTTLPSTTNTPATTGAAPTMGAMGVAEVMGVALGGVALGMGVVA